jgi:RNA methyltransferase, TrmH family
MRAAQTIASPANPLVKAVRRAIARGSLTTEGLCVAETFHLLEEALRSPCAVKFVLAAESVRPAAETYLRHQSGTRIVVLPDALMQSLSATETSQGVIALVKPPVWNFDSLFCGSPLVVLLDGLQDPGNAGSIVRAAEAFGSTGVVFLKGAVSPYNPKTLRASAGSLFRLPFLHSVDSQIARAALLDHHLALYAAVPASSSGDVPSLAAANLSGGCGLIIGNEAHGVSPEWRAASHILSIPTTGVESLNAAVAAGILLYEARRQRVSLS